MKLNPLFDRVLLKPEKTERKNSPITLPQSMEEKPITAEIVAIGDGGIIDGEKVEMTVKVGQKVLFAKYSAQEFKFEDEEYLIIRQEDILAIVE